VQRSVLRRPERDQQESSAAWMIAATALVLIAVMAENLFKLTAAPVGTAVAFFLPNYRFLALVMGTDYGRTRDCLHYGPSCLEFGRDRIAQA
jgi:Flp pilus assembly protein TadB